MTVGLRGQHRFGPDRAARSARAVLDDDRLSEHRSQPVRQEPRHDVRRAAGGRRHDPFDRPVRKRLRAMKEQQLRNAEDERAGDFLMHAGVSNVTKRNSRNHRRSVARVERKRNPGKALPNGRSSRISLALDPRYACCPCSALILRSSPSRCEGERLEGRGRPMCLPLARLAHGSRRTPSLCEGVLLTMRESFGLTHRGRLRGQ